MPPELFDTLIQQQLPQDAMISTEGPTDMSSNWIAKLLSMLKSGGKDIELPNESGMIDSRIPQTPEMQRKAFMQANKRAGN